MQRRFGFFRDIGTAIVIVLQHPRLGRTMARFTGDAGSRFFTSTARFWCVVASHATGSPFDGLYTERLRDSFCFRSAMQLAEGGEMRVSLQNIDLRAVALFAILIAHESVHRWQLVGIGQLRRCGGNCAPRNENNSNQQTVPPSTVISCCDSQRARKAATSRRFLLAVPSSGFPLFPVSWIAVAPHCVALTLLPHPKSAITLC